MLIGLDGGHFFLIFLQWRAKLLDPDWTSGKTYSLLSGWARRYAFSWLFETFCLEFSNARSPQILTFKPNYSVEKHRNQAIGWRQFERDEPKASHTDSKLLFVLKAKTLERLDAFCFLVKLRINITCVFRNCRNCTRRCATRAISAISENTSDINH